MIGRIVYGVLLLLLFLAGITVRREVLQAQVDAVGGAELPFTLESALEYRMVRQVAEGDGIPEREPLIEHPDGVEVRATYTIGAEYIYGWGAKLLPGGMSLTERVRWVALIWFCLGIPLMGLWVSGLCGSRGGGLIAAAFYAVSISAVLRSTGQELSRENVALPLLLLHLMAEVRARKAVGWRLAGWSVLSAAGLGLALVNWDMIQFYVVLWMGMSMWRLVWRSGDEAEWVSRGTVIVGVLLVAVLNPYHRAHGLYVSPLVAAGCGVLLQGVLRRYWCRFTRGWGVLLVVMLVAAGWWMMRLDAGYSHFGTLLWAKLRWLNVKPADPASLNFVQRIMWTPALNSATWRLTFQLFPAILCASIPAAAILLSHRNAFQADEFFQIALFYGISLAAFALFVRFHVYVALFGCALLGGGAGVLICKRRMSGWIACMVAVAGVLVEAGQSLSQPWRWGRNDTYYKETEQLIEYIRNRDRNEAVLANFGISASVAAYAEKPILLHPKFETETIRKRVEYYGQKLFKGTEKEFRDWADQYDAQLYIYSMGEFARTSPELQMRYFVNALQPMEHAAARLFEFHPERSRYFRMVWENRKYRVFDMVTREEERDAQTLAAAAFEALCSGQFNQAEEQATDALLMDMGNRKAQKVLLDVAALREQGVRLGAER